MVTVVVPFRAGGKSRLPDELRTELALAMLGDVLQAAADVGNLSVVTSDPAATQLAGGLAAVVVDDPGAGQGPAVAAALALVVGHALVVNADLPCATTEALRRLAATGPALVAAADGTTNALSLPDPSTFEPLYGGGSAARFAAAGLAPVSIPELEHDVDTVSDLERLTLPIGRLTTLVLHQHNVERTSAL